MLGQSQQDACSFEVNQYAMKPGNAKFSNHRTNIAIKVISRSMTFRSKLILKIQSIFHKRRIT